MSKRPHMGVQSKIISAQVVTQPGGEWELHVGGGINGRPMPSENEAWIFGEGMKVLQWFLNATYQQQQDILSYIKRRP